MNSENMQVVERLTLSDDGSALIREYVVSDPDYLKTAHTGQSSWTRSDIPIGSYDCIELGGLNNTRQ
jgi:hypothetical protein